MTKRKRELLKTHTAVPHKRFGNERAWSVTGGSLSQGQIVTVHAMCTEVSAIVKAIAQDKSESGYHFGVPGAAKTWPVTSCTCENNGDYCPACLRKRGL